MHHGNRGHNTSAVYALQCRKPPGNTYGSSPTHLFAKEGRERAAPALTTTLCRPLVAACAGARAYIASPGNPAAGLRGRSSVAAATRTHRPNAGRGRSARGKAGGAEVEGRKKGTSRWSRESGGPGAKEQRGRGRATEEAKGGRRTIGKIGRPEPADVEEADKAGGKGRERDERRESGRERSWGKRCERGDRRKRKRDGRQEMRKEAENVKGMKEKERGRYEEGKGKGEDGTQKEEEGEEKRRRTLRKRKMRAWKLKAKEKGKGNRERKRKNETKVKGEEGKRGRRGKRENGVKSEVKDWGKGGGGRGRGKRALRQEAEQTLANSQPGARRTDTGQRPVCVCVCTNRRRRNDLTQGSSGMASPARAIEATRAPGRRGCTEPLCTTTGSTGRRPSGGRAGDEDGYPGAAETVLGAWGRAARGAVVWRAHGSGRGGGSARYRSGVEWAAVHTLRGGRSGGGAARWAAAPAVGRQRRGGGSAVGRACMSGRVGARRHGVVRWSGGPRVDGGMQRGRDGEAVTARRVTAKAALAAVDAVTRERPVAASRGRPEVSKGAEAATERLAWAGTVGRRQRLTLSIKPEQRACSCLPLPHPGGGITRRLRGQTARAPTSDHRGGAPRFATRCPPLLLRPTHCGSWMDGYCTPVATSRSRTLLR
ncbi:Nipped-B-like protein B [Gryllus bimaculatus]|nr:Nipped-B-like protein B [Gryllus bimaculatus]